MIKPRAPLIDKFAVLVVPISDIKTKELTTPLTVYPTQEAGYIRVTARADKDGVRSSNWAFTKANRKNIIKQLRALADWIEENPPVH